MQIFYLKKEKLLHVIGMINWSKWIKNCAVVRSEVYLATEALRCKFRNYEDKTTTKASVFWNLSVWLWHIENVQFAMFQFVLFCIKSTTFSAMCMCFMVLSLLARWIFWDWSICDIISVAYSVFSRSSLEHKKLDIICCDFFLFTFLDWRLAYESCNGLWTMK